MEGAERAALSDAYSERSGDPANYVLLQAIPRAVMHRAGINAASRQADLLTGLFHFAVFLLLPLLVALATGSLGAASLLAWLVVALGCGYGGFAAPRGFRERLSESDSLVRCMTDVDGLRALVARSRRRYTLRFIVPWSALFAVVVTVLLPVWRAGRAAEVAPGTTAVMLLLLYCVGELVSVSIVAALDGRLLEHRRFALQSFSPLETPCVQETIRGANRAGIEAAIIATWYLIITLILLPHDLWLVLPIAAVILASGYLSIFSSVGYVRYVVSRIVAAEKARRLADLGEQLEALLSRVPDLSPEEERKLDLLRKARETVKDAPVAKPLLGTVGRVVGTVMLPTVVFFASAIAEGYIERVLNQILDAL